MKAPLFFASRNLDKVRELREILLSYRIALHSLRDFADCPETVEDRDTIYGNAIKKAIEGAKFTGMLTLADDTGLFITALEGSPGIFSARWAGEGCSYQDNRAKILLQMQGQENREAYFETAVALADRDGLISVVSGRVRGKITESERGESGFGYDSIFEVEGPGQTYAQMSDAQKNYLSHRGLATHAILPILKRILDIEEKE
ncbi:MAG: RdgB/HAM1 family non-canonical purine NTP pyrophosphatase [Candidatus Cloacimonetes bacterium]|jgi:XTP/dITP diphosphohydrolase|nr:RdgB/HAM1 family non-canonical purine NTP pyrophosphatase [Candidatus Cloacimonadota bacterium]MCB5286608.1 RdgB/HAM1 family non-canonical purine NTP pyrophosphatase [Candidatus Cloacimonadota bacterium]MCK9184352.1 RdgB/HAM1 family non-canonical purine NTP pyrophosphatase [Candidatus Cloacimonadota bacterium]MCK9583550.1 RdgB/HAM1 family non-canonical purine NTP pyrophosphatase [Candidatus Cloacimonadota bacterium]MDY0228929.1 RdgB/HAM1 family non-canonical purine NTP pyrophosphatase [Candi